MAYTLRKIRSAVVTGATGMIGAALCRCLAERGIDVYAVCRPNSLRTANLPMSDRLRVIFCDMAELGRLPELIRGKVDAFFHLAWAKTTGDGRNDMPAQVDNIRAAIEAVHAAGTLNCRVFVGAGSQAEYGRVDGILHAQTPCFPENGYGMAKLCAGQMTRLECAKLGLEHIWMRILSVYGPCDGENTMVSSVARKLLAGERPSLTAGEQLWDYLYADDAARGFYLAAAHGRGGAVYPLGSGRARPLRYYAEALRDAVDPNLPLGLGEIPYAPLQVMHLEADIAPLREDTGFLPETEFADGVKKTIAWLQKNDR